MTGTGERPAGEGPKSLKGHPHFRAVLETFAELKISCWLDQGTLLGVIREGGLLKSDHDLDLGMWEDDYRKHRREIVKRLQKRGRFVEAYKPHQLSISDLERNFSMINIAFYRRESGRAVKKVYYPVSGKPVGLLIGAVLFCAHAGQGTLDNKMPPGGAKLAAMAAKIIPVPLWNFICYSAGRAQYLFRPSFRMAVVEHFFLNLETVTVEGLMVPVPADPEKYLALKYGPDWRTPRDDWVYWKDDGAIIP